MSPWARFFCRGPSAPGLNRTHLGVGSSRKSDLSPRRSGTESLGGSATRVPDVYRSRPPALRLGRICLRLQGRRWTPTTKSAPTFRTGRRVEGTAPGEGVPLPGRGVPSGRGPRPVRGGPLRPPGRGVLSEKGPRSVRGGPLRPPGWGVPCSGAWTKGRRPSGPRPRDRAPLLAGSVLQGTRGRYSGVGSRVAAALAMARALLCPLRHCPPRAPRSASPSRPDCGGGGESGPGRGGFNKPPPRTRFGAGRGSQCRRLGPASAEGRLRAPRAPPGLTRRRRPLATPVCPSRQWAP